MNKVLVTGATGRLGANVIHRLLAKNYDVRALVIPNDPKQSKLDNLDVEIILGDLRNPELCSKLAVGIDAVIHTANLLGPSDGMSEDTFFNVNVNGTFNLLNAVAQYADTIKRFVHISSDAVYPMGNHLIANAYTPVDELHPKTPSGLYALTKMINEETIRNYYTSHGLKTTMIRPAGMFAGNEILSRWSVGFVTGLLRSAMNRPSSGLFHPDLQEHISHLESAGTTDQLCVPYDNEGHPWLYSPADVRDVADACLCVLEHPAAVGEVFNVALSRPFSFKEVANYLVEHTDLNTAIVEIELPVRWVYWSDTRKVKSLLGYQPSGSISHVFETALAHEKGELIDVIPA